MVQIKARALKIQRPAILGWNYRIGEMEAAIGRLALKQLDQWNQSRREPAAVYSNQLAEFSEIHTPIEKKWAHHIYLHYPIRVPKYRNTLQDFLEERGIETAVPYDPPIHLTQLYRDWFHFVEGMFPITEREKQEIISLPTRPTLTVEDQKTIIEGIAQFFQT